MVVVVELNLRADATNMPTQAQLAQYAEDEHQGNYRYYFEIAKFDTAFAVKFLGSRLRFPTDAPPEDFRVAQAALRQVPGVEDYLKSRLDAAISANSQDFLSDFNLLGMIGSEKASAAVAPYLFDHTPPPNMSNGVGGADIVGYAIKSLGQMHLPDDPARGKRYGQYDANDLYRWRVWAVNHGYVPKERLAEFPKPPGILDVATSSPFSLSSSPVAIATNSPVELHDFGFQWEIPAGVACLLLLAGSVVYITRKKGD